MTVFLDTVGLLAVWDNSDQWHRAAHACFAQLQAARDELVSTTFNEGAAGDELIEQRQSGVTFPFNRCPFGGGPRAALMENPLSHRVGDLQSVQRKKEHRWPPDSPVKVNGRRRARLWRQEFYQEARVGVSPHRRDSRTIFERLMFEGSCQPSG